MNFTTSHDGYVLRVYNTDRFSTYTFLCEPSVVLTTILANLKKSIAHLDGISEVIIGIDNIAVFHTVYAVKQIQHFIFSNPFILIPDLHSSHFIPIKYNGQDLDFVCNTLQLSLQQFIALHTKTENHVAMIGFLPGFAYISNEDQKMWLPRKSSPLKYVKAGSVAIASGFTGIYPIDSPGGWHIIGQTDFINFDMCNKPICRLSIGDKIQFIHD